MFRLNAALPLAVLCAIAVSPAIAQPLTMHYGAEDEQCQVMAVGFTRATGTQVAMTRKSSGEILAQVRAESQAVSPQSTAARSAPKWSSLACASSARRASNSAYFARKAARLRSWLQAARAVRSVMVVSGVVQGGVLCV